jgi:prepilin-type N-terminal cleavage/methylation domain-containing protein
MNKGFTLIETLVYISLVSILMVGVFSLIVDFIYSSSNKKDFTEIDYQILIENFHE